MKTTRGRCKVMLEFNKKRHIELIDGYYTEDENYFIYKPSSYWYVLDVNSGLSYGRGKGYVMKKDIVKDLDFIIDKFNQYRDRFEEQYNKNCKYYKKLCKEYDLKEGRK